MTFRNMVKALRAVVSGQGHLVRLRREIEQRSAAFTMAGMSAEPSTLNPQPSSPYRSQCGQDRFLAEQVFQGRRHGIFVDIGAFDGVAFSNTWYFENELGWSGLCVEPNPAVFARLVKNRKCRCANICVSDHNGMAEFIHFPEAEMFSGLAASAAKGNGKNGASPESGPQKKLTVPCVEANRLLAENSLGHVDYLSIDAEGMDFTILKSLDLARVDIEVISIENNGFGFGYELMGWLDARGYDLIGIMGDEIYRKRQPSAEASKRE